MPGIDVSIIIPAYNRLWCLPRAVESCRNTGCVTEIIVVDDGSNDGTWKWLQQQPDVVSIRQKNQGQTYAINKGLASAKGKYVRFLDSDDFLVTAMIDEQFLAAETHQAELVYSGIDIYLEDEKKIEKLPDVEPWEDFLAVQLGNGYGSHFLAMLFKTDWAQRTPRRPDFALREDRMFLLEYGLLQPKTILVKGVAGYWTKHNEQMQANYRGWQSQVSNWQHLNIYKKILAQLAYNDQLSEPRKKAACSVLWPLAHWISKHHPTEAADVVKWIFELDPGFNIPEKGILGLLYKNAGFKTTEKILRFRRLVKFS